MNTYLLEIGVEELPAKQITRVADAFKKRVLMDLENEKVPYNILDVWSTPRRLTVYIDGIQAQLADESVVITGPSLSTAYNDGQPTSALVGFLKKYNASADDITVVKKGKNDVVSLNTVVLGASSKDVLARLAWWWITAAAFDKSMRWRDYSVQFARPIRWIASLYNAEHLPVSIEGLDSDVFTQGHRTLANRQFKITEARSYLDVMKEARIIVKPDERKQSILLQIASLERKHSVTAQKDEALLDEIINIVEYPTVFSGKFDDEFLSLPVPVIVTPMKDHQRYFPAFTPDGKLSTVFFGVRNGDDYFLETVVKGNEKVLRARLKDARFFFDSDRKKRLEDFADGLKTVLYQAKLGTVYDKVTRIKAIASYIAELIDLSDDNVSLLHRAVDLCKADLNTATVNEFDELQGVMGRIYAMYDGEDDAVSVAIESHYRPRFAEDEIPADILGKIISVADKTDSLVGSFGIGVTPSGGKDPFGLRRMMIGILSVLLGGGSFNPNLELIISKSAELLTDKFSEDKDECIKQVKKALRHRLRFIMNDKGYRFDAVEAAIADSLSDITAFIAKCGALSQYDRVSLEAITTNILRSIKLSASAVPEVSVNPALFENESESKMYAAAVESAAKIGALAKAYDYAAALTETETLGNAVDKFLEDVMVMHEDEKIRCNRIQIMRICADASRLIADFTKLQFSN